MCAAAAGEASPSPPATTARPTLRLHPEAFREGLTNHPDQEFADSIVTACTQGVDIGYKGPRHLRIHDNWPSVYKNCNAVCDVISKDIAAGITFGPFTHPPFPHFVSSPMGAFQKKHSSKYRVVHDLSYPPGTPSMTTSTLMTTAYTTYHSMMWSAR